MYDDIILGKSDIGQFKEKSQNGSKISNITLGK